MVTGVTTEEVALTTVVVLTTAEEGTTEEVTLVEAEVMVGVVVEATDPLRMSDGRRKDYLRIK